MKLQGAVFALTLLMVCGCSTFELETGSICGNQGMALDSESETVHGSLWGFQWVDHTVEKCDSLGHCGLYRVEYHTNAFFLAASVLSLGLYVPQTVEWWCLVERRDDSGHERFDPDEDENMDEDEDDGQVPSSTKPVGEGKDSS